MPDPAKQEFSERDICSKFITPAITAARWDLMTQIREEVSFTKLMEAVVAELTAGRS